MQNPAHRTGLLCWAQSKNGCRTNMHMGMCVAVQKTCGQRRLALCASCMQGCASGWVQCQYTRNSHAHMPDGRMRHSLRPKPPSLAHGDITPLYTVCSPHLVACVRRSLSVPTSLPRTHSHSYTGGKSTTAGQSTVRKDSMQGSMASSSMCVRGQDTGHRASTRRYALKSRRGCTLPAGQPDRPQHTQKR
jgi:hypothetical protein